MNKAFVAIFGASVLVASTAGFAGGPSTVSKPVDNSAGFYLNGNLGYGHYDVDTTGLSDLGISIDRDSFAWSANVGYQFNPYIAVEVGYMQLPHATLKGDGIDSKLKTDAVTLVAKGIYPVNELFDIFGKAGLAYESQSATVNVDGVSATEDGNEHHITPLFGLGVDYNLSRNWAIGIQGITTLKSSDDFPATYTALAGVTYKFS